MEGFIFFILLNMLWIGPVQVLVGLVGVFTARNPTRRKHYGIYLIGVACYFSILSLLGKLDIDVKQDGLGIAFFFLGALSLMIYQLIIIFGVDKLSPAGPR